MGRADDKPGILTPRLEAWEAALRIYAIPKDRWQQRIDDARTIFSIYHKSAKVSFASVEETDMPDNEEFED